VQWYDPLQRLRQQDLTICETRISPVAECPCTRTATYFVVGAINTLISSVRPFQLTSTSKTALPLFNTRRALGHYLGKCRMQKTRPSSSSKPVETPSTPRTNTVCANFWSSVPYLGSDEERCSQDETSEHFIGEWTETRHRHHAQWQPQPPKPCTPGTTSSPCTSPFTSRSRRHRHPLHELLGL